MQIFPCFSNRYTGTCSLLQAKKCKADISIRASCGRIYSLYVNEFGEYLTLQVQKTLMEMLWKKNKNASDA